MGLGNEVEEVKNLKKEGFTVIYRDLNPSVESAKNIEAAGTDIIIATGYDEGGGLPSHSIGTMTIMEMYISQTFFRIIYHGRKWGYNLRNK